ncbi:MAG TPA: trypsin-like serine protease [Candidatus Limnocylindrales bacterium]
MGIGRLRLATVAMAACAAVLGTATPGIAGIPDTKTRLDPNTAVADDGTMSGVPRSLGGLRGVNGYDGTGVTGGDGASHEPDTSKIGPPIDDGVGVQSVFLPDGRVRQNPTTSFPSRATVFLTRTIPNGDGTFRTIAWCSGWMIGADTLATAGHCLNTGGGGAWYPTGEFRAWPGANGSVRPYGSCTARRLHSVVGWTVDGNRNFDYGAIKLNCTVGNTVGWYGMWWQTATLTGLSTTVRGYPVDKPFGEQWFHSDQVRITEDRRIFYRNDTFNGHSGSPVYQNRAAGSPFCVGQCSMGIHTTGGSTNNGGTRMVEPVFNNLIAWRDAA